MATETQQATIKIRRDTAANWTSNDPTPNEGEWCLETDTKKIKIGDGSTAWTSLDYYLYDKDRICTAWVNFNGTGTVAIRDSYNVDSITDLGTGDYQINFTDALANTNYSVVTSCVNISGGVNRDSGGYMTSTAACRVTSWQSGAGTNTDVAYISVAVFGGVA